MRKVQIGVIGDSSCSDAEKELAYIIGKTIAQSGCILICGGRGGVMEGASKGCKDHNGLVVGILPEFDEESSKANSYLDVAIPTNMGWTRNSFVPLASDGLLVIGGKSGTMSEIAFSWMYNKPIVSLDNEHIPKTSWGRKVANSSLDNRRSDTIVGIEDPVQAVKIILDLIKKNRKYGSPQI